MRNLARYFTEYLRMHRLTAGVILASALVLVALLPVAWSLYRDRSTNIFITITSLGAKPHVKAVYVNISRRFGQPDRLSLTLSLDPWVKAEGEAISLTLPRTLHLTDHIFFTPRWSVNERYDRDSHAVFYYVTPSSAKAPDSCELPFEGDVLTEGSDVDLHLAVFVDSKWMSGYVPVEILMSGLDDLAIDQMIPEPHERTSTFARFTFPAGEDRAGPGAVSITVRGLDRAAAARGQFRLFLVATIIGVLLSVISAGLQALFLEYDRSRSRLGS